MIDAEPNAPMPLQPGARLAAGVGVPAPAGIATALLSGLTLWLIELEH